MNSSCIHLRAYAFAFVCAPLFLAAMVTATGCNSSNEGEMGFSQKFEPPPGMKLNPVTDFGRPMTHKERRLQDEKEELEAAKTKGKRRRP